MDWTAVYVESGEEDLLIPFLLEEHSTAPRVARFVSRLYHVTDNEQVEDDTLQVTHHRLFELFERHPSSSYTLRALYFLCINYILGVGCLGVPYAFARAGFLLCTVVLVTVTLLSYMTVLWVAESGARLELMLGEEAEQRQDQEARESTSLIQTHVSAPAHVHIDGDRYEVVDLVSFYLGSIHKTIYQISLMALMYIGLLAYTQVFCGSIATLLPDGITGLPQLVFAIMVVPLSCYDLDEQVAIQSLMATVRFVALFIMIGGSVLALWLDDGLSERSRPPYFAPSEPEGCQMSYTACFSGFGVAFSTALFSQLFQHSVPGLLHPLRDQSRKIVQAPVGHSCQTCARCFHFHVLTLVLC
jgi:amino acid permease